MIGVSYNIFDGEELLSRSIQSIRGVVGHVNVVYQKISNFGENNPYIEETLRGLQRKKLINSMILYNPDFNLTPKQNEIKKRNIGLDYCRRIGVKHFMSMDADEFYFPNDILKMRRYCTNYGFDATACRMEFYYKDPTIKLVQNGNFYVSGIFTVYPHTKFILNYEWPILVDPSRKFDYRNLKIIEDKEDVCMHHYSYIRNNIRLKYNNKSAKINIPDENIEEFCAYYDKYEAGQKALILNRDKKLFHDVEIVKNYFNI